MPGFVTQNSPFVPDNVDVPTVSPSNDSVQGSVGERFRSAWEAGPFPQASQWLGKQYGKVLGPDLPDMQPDEVKSSFGLDVKKPMNFYDAQFMAQRQDAKEKESLAFQNNNGVANFGVRTAAFFADPLNAATALIPPLGEARIASLLGKAGIEVAGNAAARVGVRAAAGAGGFAAGQAPLSAIDYGLDKQANIDHSIADSLREVLFAGVLGSAFHPLFGALGDAWKGEVPIWARAKYSERSDAAQTGLSQLMNERPIDVPDFKPPSNELNGALEIAQSDKVAPNQAEAALKWAMDNGRDDIANRIIQGPSHEIAVKAQLEKLANDIGEQRGKPLDTEAKFLPGEKGATTTPEEFALSQQNLAREGTSFGSSQAELKETQEAAESATKAKPLEPTKELADLQQKADDAETQLKAAYGVIEGAVKEPGLLGKAVQKVKEAVTGKPEENLPPELQEKLKEANGHKEYADILAKSYDALKNCMMG